MSTKTVFAALGLLSILTAQAAAPIHAQGFKTEILGDFFYVEGKINGQPVRLVVDSGAGMNVLNPDSAKRVGVEGGQKVNATGAGSTPVVATLAKLKKMEIGDASVENEDVVILPLPKELECDGLVGYSFLRHFATTFDYQKGTIKFEEPAKFAPEAGASVLPLGFRSNIPQVMGSVDGFEGWMNIDTGANGSLSLFGPFVEKNKLRDRYPKRISTMTGAGVGGVTMGDVVRISTVKIGDIALPPIVVDLSRQTKGVFASDGPIGNIGYDILHRFVFTLDYPGKRFVLKKSPAFGEPSDTNRSGLFLSFDGKVQRVVWVLPSSPASEAGFKFGDVLVAVDDKPAQEIPSMILREAFRRPAGTVVKLKVKRGEEAPFEVKLTLREIVP